jgi:hypothetical protein
MDEINFCSDINNSTKPTFDLTSCGMCANFDNSFTPTLPSYFNYWNNNYTVAYTFKDNCPFV